MRTITEASNELDVSRKKIYNYIKKLDIKTIKDSNGNFIEDKDFDKLKIEIKASIKDNNKDEMTENVRERAKNVLERDRSIVMGKISDREYVDLKDRIMFLENQLGVKDKQIQVKDEQIRAKDGQINGLIQSNYNFSQALLPPPEQAITVEEAPKESWIKRKFKRKRK